MATATLGTALTSSLTAIKYATGGLLPADLYTIQKNILDDSVPAANPTIYPGGITQGGMLYVPNRGYLRVFPGDYVAIDTQTGWPILISARAAAGAAWVHVP